MRFILFTILLLPFLSKAQSAWEYSSGADKMTFKPIYVAKLKSTNELDFKFPYDGGSIATIEIDNFNGSNQVLLSVSKGQFNTNENGMNITISFDGNKPQMFRCGNLSAGQTDEIYLQADKKFINLLKKSTVVRIQAEFYDEGDKVMEFNVAGLDWDHK